MVPPRKFDEVRAWLHHDRMKNDFLNTMGYYPTDVGNEARGRIMRAAGDGDEAERRRLLRGCKVWESLGGEIRAFITSLPERYGFLLTDTYERECRSALQSLDVLDATIERLRRRAPEESDIETFWKAADVVRLLLNDMARTRRFPEYVSDIDPALITEDDVD